METSPTLEDAYQITERFERPEFLQIDVSVNENTMKEEVPGYLKTIMSEVRVDYPHKPVVIEFFNSKASFGVFDSRKSDRLLPGNK